MPIMPTGAVVGMGLSGVKPVRPTGKAKQGADI
jgi:hypothetical protein